MKKITLIFFTVFIHTSSFAFFSFLTPERPLCTMIKNELNDLQPPLFAGQQTLSEHERKSALIYQSLAELIFQKYISEDVKPSSFLECFGLKGMVTQANVLEATYLPSTFFQSTIKILKNSSSPQVRRFGQDVETALNTGAITFLDINMPGDARHGGRGALQFGGFHRGQNGLYMNPNDLPANQWFLIFFHEFAHALDESLKKAVIEEARAPLVPTLENAILQDRWTREEEREISRMIRISFDRGFAGEYRAWMTAIALYYHNGQTPRVEWVEQMIGHRSRFDRPAQQNLFQFLDPRFENQPQGIFADPRVQRVYQNIRSEWRRSPPTLGNLQRYL